MRPVDGGDEYIVDSIVAAKGHGPHRLYRVRWEGYDNPKLLVSSGEALRLDSTSHEYDATVLSGPVPDRLHTRHARRARRPRTPRAPPHPHAHP